MRALYLLMSVYLSLCLAGCNTIATKDQLTRLNPPSAISNDLSDSIKNPLAVALYPAGQHPEEPYTVVGKETVSKYNFGGIKRQTATILDTMRRMAAAVGGDAIIDISHDKQVVTGTIIAYEKSGKAATDVS